MHFFTLQGVSYAHADGTTLLSDISLKLTPSRYGLVGSNGSGKTTLLRLLSGELQPNAGAILGKGTIGYLPQIDPFDDATTVEEVFMGFKRYEVELALDRFGSSLYDLDRPLGTLSGGERIRLRIARVCIEEPDWLFLDEPTNHLDLQGRLLLYQIVETWHGGLLVVSHDRELLELMDVTLELSNLGLRRYGGPYSFYRSQRDIEDSAVAAMIGNREAIFERERRTQQRELERIARRASAGRRHAVRTNLPKQLRGELQRKAQTTTGKRRAIATGRIAQARLAYDDARMLARRDAEITFDMPNSAVAKGKIVFSESQAPLEIIGPERIAVSGLNGSGKTTLLRRIHAGARVRSAYLDQRLDMLPKHGTLAEGMRDIAPLLAEHERRVHLGRLGFEQRRTAASVAHLSGGERMRAALAMLLVASQPPQLLLLDEPETHLDLVSLEQLEAALRGYRGALVIVSHDLRFLEAVGIERELHLGES